MSRQRFYWLITLVAALSVSQASQAASFLYGSGHTLDEARLSTFGGHTLAGTFTCTNTTWAEAFAGDLGSFDIIMVGEGCSPSLSAGTFTAISDYVSGGGRMIVLGGHFTGEDTFLNMAFGYSTNSSLGADTCCESTTAALTAAASATSFAGGPLTVSNANATWPLQNTPGTTIYEHASGDTYAFVAPHGSGEVVFLAWDFCCGSDVAMDEWYAVLGEARRSSTTPVPVFAPAGLAALILLISVFGAVLLRRRGVV